MIEDERMAKIEEEAATEEEEQEIVIPYVPRKIWAEKIHPALDKVKRAVIVAHRQLGKTTGMLAQLVKSALSNPKKMPLYAYIAPYRNQAKLISWETLKSFVTRIPGIKINESELYVEFPTQHEGMAGARIYIIGADKPDALRGPHWDGVVFDEYADIKPELWSKVIMASVLSTKGFAYFIGTPKGENQFFEIYRHAIGHPTKTKESPAWYSLKLNVYETGIFTEEEILEAKDQNTDIAFAQEFMCDFTVSAEDVVIPIHLINEASKRTIKESDITDEVPTIIGVDVARFGDDRTTIWIRKGNYVLPPRIYTKLDVQQVADRVMFAINDYRPSMTFIDVGNMGAGVIDILRHRGCSRIEEVAFGSRACQDTRYENIRAEMYFKLKDAMKNGLALPQDSGEYKLQDLRKELAVQTFKYTKRDRIQLIPKEEVKVKLGCSPDLADGLALTFAREVAWNLSPETVRYKGQKLMCNTKYTILSDENLYEF